ncbi:hypothetical protein EYZ11_013549 [Aspergillus tanneri]|uniref:Uncharacterized protein n=1 Tax=Aspergillus tanneri TaxID=1220188 RepID=A0A4S3IXE4_9EURO|nr:hypothetical protein EYZ11_013549 [Aspergillus tanneri]
MVDFCATQSQFDLCSLRTRQITTHASSVREGPYGAQSLAGQTTTRCTCFGRWRSQGIPCHVEICNDDLLQEPRDPSASLTIIDFLLSFHGLQHLYLKVANFPRSVHGFQDAIYHHRSTPQSLVYHERQLVPIDTDRTFEDVRDIYPSWVPEAPGLLSHITVTA